MLNRESALEDLPKRFKMTDAPAVPVSSLTIGPGRRRLEQRNRRTNRDSSAFARGMPALCSVLGSTAKARKEAALGASFVRTYKERQLQRSSQLPLRLSLLPLARLMIEPRCTSPYHCSNTTPVHKPHLHIQIQIAHTIENQDFCCHRDRTRHTSYTRTLSAIRPSGRAIVERYCTSHRWVGSSAKYRSLRCRS